VRTAQHWKLPTTYLSILGQSTAPFLKNKNLVMGQGLGIPITKTFKLNFRFSQLITVLAGSDIFGKFSQLVYLKKLILTYTKGFKK